MRLRFPGDGSAVYHGPTGLTGTFTRNGSGSYVPRPGLKMTLTAVSGGGWTLNDHGSGDTRHFNSSGWLTELTDRNGNAVTFAYTAEGALTRIRTDVGTVGASTLTVTTEGTGRGRITTISQTADGAAGATRSVSLSYDADGYLSGMTDPAGRVTEFFHGTNGNLNRITAPGGAATEMTYDELGRVQSISQPTADAAVRAVTRFAYPAGQTQVADPNSDQATSVGATARTSYDLTGDG